jgi:arginase family enzyme
MSRELEELDDRVNTLEQQVGGHESDGLRSDIRLIGEAIGIIRRILADLVEATPEADQDEYTDDLERLTTIEHLTKFSS